VGLGPQGPTIKRISKQRLLQLPSLKHRFPRRVPTTANGGDCLTRKVSRVLASVYERKGFLLPTLRLLFFKVSLLKKEKKIWCRLVLA